MTRQSNNPLFLLFFVATILSIHSCSHNRWKGKDPQIDAIFYHPEERPYEKILASLAAKYEKDFHLSDREVIKAYPITAEEFDYFYETYNPQSEYGDYQADTLSFFVYVDKTIDSLAMNGNVECIYKKLNSVRYCSQIQSINEEWLLDDNYYGIGYIIDSNLTTVRYLFSMLDTVMLKSSFCNFAHLVPEFLCQDPMVNAIFYHPEERPYEKILASLAAKYEKDFHLSDREVIKAYPITAEEFDYFYETYNPQSEYGDYQADTLSFFVYVDKTIDSLARNGNVECIYKVFNVYRFMDTKRNASLNGQWNISAGYQRLNDIIDTNRRVVRELFSLLGEHDLVKYYSQFHDVYSGS